MNKLIFDRTIADSTYAKENPSSTRFLKGAYNYTDLNRIEEWCEYLNTELNNAGYVSYITTKTDWTMDDTPTQDDYERIRRNISTLKSVFYSQTNVPDSVNRMTIEKANDLERILNEMYRLMWGMENWYVYSGVSRVGQPKIWQHRYRQFFTPVDIRGEVLLTEAEVEITTEANVELEEDVQ